MTAHITVFVFVAVLIIGPMIYLAVSLARHEDTGRHCAGPDRADALEEPRADWVVARFREDWERVRVREGVPLPPLRSCCLATVDEPHTAACGSDNPLIIPAGRHAAAMPRRKPMVNRQPWQTAQNPALRDQPIVPRFAREAVYGQAPVATVLKAPDDPGQAQGRSGTEGRGMSVADESPLIDADDWEEACFHECDEECEDYQGFSICRHQHCFACGGCQCPGYCDDNQTYNLRPPSETGGDR